MNPHEDILCHCDQTEFLPQDGHPLGTPGCASEIKAASRTSALCRLDHGSSPIHSSCHGSARGTCPECGKYVRVVKVAFKNSDGKSLFGMNRPGMAPHKVTGRECSGTGQVPTETAFTPGRTEVEYFAALEREDVAS
jgi:hypothetical protein